MWESCLQKLTNIPTTFLDFYRTDITFYSVYNYYFIMVDILALIQQIWIAVALNLCLEGIWLESELSEQLFQGFYGFP